MSNHPLPSTCFISYNNNCNAHAYTNNKISTACNHLQLLIS